MISDARLGRVLARRETHRSRSGSAVVMLIVLLLVAAYVGTECTLAALRLRPLLVSPADALRTWQAGSLTGLGGAVLGGAAVAAVVGIVALVLAVTASRRPRHRVDDDRSVILLDDDLLASAVSLGVARRAGVAPAQARTAVGRSAAAVDVTPISGLPLSDDEVRQYAEQIVTDLQLRPRVRVRARIASSGVVGG